MKANEIRTLEQFASFINEQDDWTEEMWLIMEMNGWKECDNDNYYDICESDSEILTFGEDGKVYVTRK